MKIILKILLFTTLLNAKEYPYINNIVVSLSKIETVAEELVYQDSSNPLLSKLIWQMEDTTLLGIHSKLQFKDNTYIKLDYSIKVSDNKALMDDYDWLNDNINQWTDWSHHDNTKVNDVIRLNINLAIPVYIKNKYDLFLLLGYKKDYFKWTTFGGNYIYTYNTFRDSTGSFSDNDKGISYEQIFNTPYIGIKGSYKIKHFLFSSKLIASNIATAEGNDNHFSRNLYFEDRFNNIEMYEANINIELYLNKNSSIGFVYDKVEYKETKGSETVTKTNTGVISYYPKGSVGISNKSTSTSLYYSYSF